MVESDCLAQNVSYGLVYSCNASIFYQKLSHDRHFSFQVSRTKHKAQIRQSLDSFDGHVGSLGTFLAPQLELSPLTLCPNRQLRVLGVLGWHVAVPVLFPKVNELGKSLLPE